MALNRDLREQHPVVTVAALLLIGCGSTATVQESTARPRQQNDQRREVAVSGCTRKDYTDPATTARAAFNFAKKGDSECFYRELALPYRIFETIVAGRVSKKESEYLWSMHENSLRIGLKRIAENAVGNLEIRSVDVDKGEGFQWHEVHTKFLDKEGRVEYMKFKLVFANGRYYVSALA